MVDKVECSVHGPQDETFVCCHLVESLRSGNKVGFYYASEPRGDAWCESCEEMRVREGGESGDWNDKSSSYANVKLLCGACYDQVKRLNGF